IEAGPSKQKVFSVRKNPLDSSRGEVNPIHLVAPRLVMLRADPVPRAIVGQLRGLPPSVLSKLRPDVPLLAHPVLTSPPPSDR
ncbi:hypothetical protein, partial [Salinibacter ruber]|uniref:hypothetical protein n=1 Tax=Salinibacter ruber TaxID=146919 RepID=UPI00207437A2